MEWILLENVEQLSQEHGDWRSQQLPTGDIAAPSRTVPGSVVLFLQARKNTTLTPADAALRESLSSKYAIPRWLWRAREQDHNGYFYGASLPSASNDVPSKHVSVFRFMIKYVIGTTPRSGTIPNISYDWHVLTFVAYWERGIGSTLLCFNVPLSLREGIRQSLLTTGDFHQHPFALLTLVLEQVVELYDHAIWQFRDFVRGAERHRPSLLQRPEPDYIAMHELARHTMHSSEVLTTALNVMDHMLTELDKLSSVFLGLGTQPDCPDPGPTLRYQKCMLQFMLNRSVALENRLQNEIELAFHVTAQHTNVLSMGIARATKADGSALKTISILGLFFLPGTFVSAIFSMSFFDYSDNGNGVQRWSISDKFWVYGAIAVPLTAVTVAMWWCWPLLPSVGSASRGFERAAKDAGDVS